MEKSPNCFPYEPLSADGSEIRLVTILLGDKDDEVKCTVKNYQLFENKTDGRPIEYEALSYVWGDATDTTSISLNGCPFLATKNLESALRDLRREGQLRLIWIDAICIDQRNIPERNREVRRMGGIYRNAERVVIWLGFDVEEMRKMKLTRESVANRTCEMVRLLANADPGDLDAAARILKRSDNPTEDVWLLGSLFSGPWFERIWVLQEVALARAVVILYGIQWLDWDMLMAAADALRQDRNPANRHLWSLTGALRAGRVNQCRIRARGQDQAPGRTPPLVQYGVVDLLWQTRDFDCSEPRDRLFGILGLVEGDLGGEELLKIDYGKPVADVFWHLSIFLMQRGLFGHVLCSATGSLDDMPSWASNWTSLGNGSQLGPALGSTDSSMSVGIMGHMQSYQIKGIPQPPNPPRFSPNLRQVTLKGIIFSRVVHVGRRFDPVPINVLDGVDHLVQLYRARLIQWEDERPSGENTSERRARQRYLWKCAILHELPGGKESVMGQTYDLLTDRENELPLSTESALIARAASDLWSALGPSLEYRTPFITAIGQIGSTGVNCEVHEWEDKLCMLVGSSVPYLVRPVDEDNGLYCFVGCCWLPEWMEIDIVEGERQRYWKLMDITLV